MTAARYDHANDEIGKGNIDHENDDIRAILIDSADYTVDLATHQNLDDIPAAARVAVSGNLANKSVSGGGVFDADDVTFSSVSGDTVEAIVLYKHTGVESTSTLLSYDDEATGFALTPNGGNVDCQWSNGANKIYHI